MVAPSTRTSELDAQFGLAVGSLQVRATSPWLMEAAREELGSRCPPTPAGGGFRVSLSHRTPAPRPPLPLQAGALLDGYLCCGAQLWLRGPGGAEFYADSHAATAHVFLPESLRGEVGRALGAGLPLLLSHLFRGQGFWTIHAAAVAWGSRAVLIPGVSGSGKSTTAAILASHPAFRLLADDRVLLRGPEPLVFGLPGRTRLRSPASSWLKPGESMGDGLGRSPALLLFPSVAPGSPSRWTPVGPMTALRRLLSCSVAPGPPDVVEQHLAAVAALARSVPAGHLQLGEDWGGLPHQVQELLAESSRD